MLIGALVGLVPLQMTDDVTMFRWLNDPVMRRSAGRPAWKACYSMEQVQDLIKERLGQPSRFDLVAIGKADGTPQGLVELTHLHPMRDSAEISLIWEGGDEDMMEEALCTAVEYAFNAHGLHRLWGRVPSANQMLINIYQRAGFRVDGVLREDHFNGGMWRDSVLLSLLSSEARPC